MASFTIRTGYIPDGTTVSAYPASNWPQGLRPPTTGSAPQGAATATAVSASGSATFTGLAVGTHYYAYDTTSTTYVSFRTDPASTSSATGLTGPVFNVTDAAYGAKGDGVTDDYAAILAARDAASAAGGGVVYAPGGATPRVYKTLTQITSWPDNVHLVGDGPGETVFRPTIAGRFISVTDRAAGTPLTNAQFRGFELDGSNLSGATSKGIHMQHVKDCKWIDLYIHDCGYTGLGPDFLYGACVIDRVRVENNGRLNDGTQASGNGIGIGSRGNATIDEPVVVTNCVAINNKRYGIEVEAQVGGNSGQFSSGARIVGNFCKGNQVGIGDCGNRRSVIVGNTCTANSQAGIAADGGTFSGWPGYEGVIASNACYLNTGAGIRLSNMNASSPATRMYVKGNAIGENQQGILVQLDATDMLTCVITENVIHDNNFSGIRIYYAGATNTAGVKFSNISRNDVYNNGKSAGAGDRDGIRIMVPVSDTAIDNNNCWDRLGTKTQGFGIILGSTITGGSVRGNDCRNNLTGSISFSSAPSSTTALEQNLGYTPPAPASVTPAASPWTYTAPNIPSWLFLSGGTVSSVTVGGAQVATSSNVPVPLEPGDAAIVTYSAAPTAMSRAR